MNTEPPEGDDLQRMLVAMKRNVLDHATPRPKRRRGRSGVVIAVVALLALGTATGAVALSLTQQDQPVAGPTRSSDPEPAPTTTTSGSAPITATPRPSSTAPAVVATGDATIPTACRATVPSADYGRLFGDREPVQLAASTDDGSVDPRWDGGPTSLACQWGASEGPSPGLSLVIGTGTQAQLATGKSTFFQGWQPTCQTSGGAERCSATDRNDEGTDLSRTRYQRDGVWIEVIQGNFPTNGLLDAVIGQIWGPDTSVDAHRFSVCEAGAAASGVRSLRQSGGLFPEQRGDQFQITYAVAEFTGGQVDPYAYFVCDLSDDGAQAEFVGGGLIDSH